MLYEVKCKSCQMSFNSRYKRTQFCNNKCRMQFHANTNKYRSGTLGINGNTVGAVSELAVAIDLFKKGYDVYRSLSPSSKGDLLIEKRNNNNKYLKIEVKTGYKNPKNFHVYYPKIKGYNYDILALVIWQFNEIIYKDAKTGDIIKLD